MPSSVMQLIVVLISIPSVVCLMVCEGPLQSFKFLLFTLSGFVQRDRAIRPNLWTKRKYSYTSEGTFKFGYIGRKYQITNRLGSRVF